MATISPFKTVLSFCKLLEWEQLEVISNPSSTWGVSFMPETLFCQPESKS